MTAEAQTQDGPVQDVTQTSCCIVGGGPAGVILSLLLPKRGVDVTLLEAHKDFDRDFRGDTVHPSTMELLDQFGLADGLLKIPHAKIPTMNLFTPQGQTRFADFGRLPTRFPYITMLPQVRFLEYVAEECKRSPLCKIVMGANVQRLVEENGVVKGVRYRDAENHWHEVRAPLTIAADGRFSRVRHLLGWEPIKTAPPMDVLWFRLPHLPTDQAENGAGYLRGNRLIITLDRDTEWQMGYLIPKGGYQDLRAQGIDALQRSIAEIVPWLADRVNLLTDWKQVTLLSVESSRLKCWHRPGVLLIGDAAHAMSPVGGVGINYAIQDAIATSNILAGPLKAGTVTDADLAKVQKRREWPTRVIQTFQGQIQKRIIANAFKADKPFGMPLVFRAMLSLPWFHDLPARLFAFGLRRERFQET